MLALVLCSCEDRARIFSDAHSRNLNELHWSSDTLTNTGAPLTLTGLDGQAKAALYAVGTTADSEAVILRFDGAHWTTSQVYPSPSYLHGIVTAGPFDVWAVGGIGDSALVLSNSGSGWEALVPPPSPPLLTVDAGSGYDVWCGGEQGVVLHAVLFSWQRYDLGRNLTIESIAEVTSSDVYAIARRNDLRSPFDYPYYLYNFNGAVWSRVDSIPPSFIGLPQRFGIRLYTNLARLYSLGPGLFFFNLNRWQQQVAADTLRAMYLENPNNIIAVGNSVFHFDGVQWYAYQPLSGGSVRWMDVWMDASNVFLLGSLGGSSIVEHGE